MAQEIERKFLLKRFPANLPIAGKKEITQFYTEISPEKEVRYRRISADGENHYYRTEKVGNGLVRKESEREVGSIAFNLAMDSIVGNIIRKTRYVTNSGEEIDVYHGVLDGLITMEKEFASKEDAAAYVPPVAATEVTNNNAYKNKNLALRGLNKKGGNV